MVTEVVQEFTIYDPYLNIYGVGKTIAEAAEEFDSMRMDLLAELTESEAVLSDRLREQLQYLRAIAPG